MYPNEKKVILENHEYIEILEYDYNYYYWSACKWSNWFTVNILSDCMHITILVLSLIF